MISASTWFDPYNLEVLVIPLAVILGMLSAWITKRVILGPLVYVSVTILFYMWIYVYFYSSDSSQFFAVHMNDLESYIIETFFIGTTWILSWGLIKAQKKTKLTDELL
ncbi:hypothetical protein [Alkalihalobacterium chitinilyticum]|uniref:Lycopene cyclase domain-containing protein n=1 Tax=Alkalihalobacterium chitinilyticum TaxID=2980103 RepID=A0ABT5VI99_9BACI|nr:hypothetical protein [Alkalihalobacterium chitinilyticum]MDE5415178.1 hypothetical protein [Alkalihalobacterium chitinilyticum]